jgi:hypothetical protein
MSKVFLIVSTFLYGLIKMKALVRSLVSKIIGEPLLGCQRTSIDRSKFL